jgi:hypothetical protein
MLRESVTAYSLFNQGNPFIQYSPMKCLLQSFYTTRRAILFGHETDVRVVPRWLDFVGLYRVRIPIHNFAFPTQSCTTFNQGTRSFFRSGFPGLNYPLFRYPL